jgi:hypothetical protein
VGKVLQRVTAERTAVLAAGERFVAAGRARTVPGTETAGHFPPLTIWAVTEQRLFVWEAAGRGNSVPGQVIAEMPLGTLVVRATVEPYESRESLLTVYAGEHPAMVLMDTADARAVAQQVGAAVAAMPAAVAPVAAPTFVVEPVDPCAGDDRIAAFRQALVDGDWAQAAEVFASAEAPAERELFVQHLDGDDFAAALDAWVEERPDDADPYLARGANTVLGAFRRRAEAAGPVADETFWSELRDAERDLAWAVELDFADPVPWTPLLRSARGLSIPKEELCMRYDESARRDPALLGAHLETLEALSPIGVGSVDELFAFARTMARAAPEGSPLHSLVAMAHLVNSVGLDDSDPRRKYFSGDPSREIEFFARMSVENEAWKDGPEVVEALNIFAAAFAKCGDRPRARALLERVGVSRSVRPWAMLPDGDELFHEVVTATA